MTVVMEALRTALPDRPAAPLCFRLRSGLLLRLRFRLCLRLGFRLVFGLRLRLIELGPHRELNQVRRRGRAAAFAFLDLAVDDFNRAAQH